VLLTRDLRVHDQPALAAACATFDRVVPLYVLDPALEKLSANRSRFLHQALVDLREALRRRGGDLVVRHGDPVAETIRLARQVEATGVAVSGDVSRYARRRERRLREECERHRMALRIFPGVTVVDPGALRPTGGSHYKVFTPYFRAWSAATWRDPVDPPRRVTLPPDLDRGDLPAEPAGESPRAAPGGETAARRRLHDWAGRLDRYAEAHDDMPGDGTSRLSPYVRFGCVSPLELARLTPDRGHEFARQLCWRDFFYQVTLANPGLATVSLRPRAADEWRDDTDALAAWEDGRTGLPVVDAGMRQLRAEGWMHNRARLITAAFLVKHLGVDWRAGLAVFNRWLLDGDLPDNAGNWQWVAGVGNDPRPNRGFNPVRQALRFDPHGTYVRRYVPELAEVSGPAVHRPWALPAAVRVGLDYPPPLDAAGRAPGWLE
jgi:deoxyribodipyrimidine photo-lyase